MLDQNLSELTFRHEVLLTDCRGVLNPNGSGIGQSMVTLAKLFHFESDTVFHRAAPVLAWLKDLHKSTYNKPQAALSDARSALQLCSYLVNRTSPYTVMANEYCGLSPSDFATASLAIFVASRAVAPPSHSRRNGSSQQ